MNSMTIALLGQPNSGKSTLFNGLTGSRQHVGNWPGKTVEQKEGYFVHNGKRYTVVDLPGTYSLSANSDEEIVTREYIASGKADLVCILADASQLERSLFMLADYTGIRTPVILLLNMMDVAVQQGKDINSASIAKKLGIQVVPITAADRKCYDVFLKALDEAQKTPAVLNEKDLLDLYNKIIGSTYRQVFELLPREGVGSYSSAWLAAKLLERDEPAMDIVKSAVSAEIGSKLTVLIRSVENGSLLTGDCKFKWIETLLKDSVSVSNIAKPKMGRFDRIATNKTWGKPLAIGIIILGLVISMAIAMPLMGLFSSLTNILSPMLSQALTAIGTPAFLISLLCDGVLTAVSFALMMVSFVFGISLIFGFLEEIGYMARISYAFDNTMSKLGLQGKAVMPFLVSFGCNIGGVTGTRVIDSWGQRVTTMALSWVVPCAATWGVVGLMSSVFFGSGAIFVVLSLFAVALLHMVITSKIMGIHLIKETDRSGLIMELPPYHKPKFKNLFRFVFNRMGDVLIRALKVIVLVSVLFWALSYTGDGTVANSVIYKIGTFIEPVTMFFGLRWQTFMAFLASAMGKEAALGVLASLFNTTGESVGVWGAITGHASVNTSALGGALITNISKAEALAFIYAFFFNIPCLMAVASTQQESHSLKWTLRIVGYYIAVALLMSALAYNVGRLIF
ncbi:ferrous iron transport protein B [Petroclostridium sp. X23]|uniref:ferrous iron transport protein B n=1 Tax=Petroclostridium sp. X23 TaxID=3045146 RepID=UPI0024ADC2A5|nr:ferrous iron transport protein B [Petroclostridium sp. X23]WHH58704.1 ferrous iron transport protein B [Petroclostridium sp. X23]